MNLFINSGVCKRKWNGNVILRKKGDEVTIRIPNYLNEEKKNEYVEFVIPDCNKKMLKKDILLLNLFLQQKEKNKYVFSKDYDMNSRCMYALVRSVEVVPDDVYIPAYMKERVEVIRRLSFVDSEADVGEFLSNVYFIKITLEPGERIPICLTSQKATVIRERFYFYRPSIELNSDWEIRHDKQKLKIEYKNFISLSEIIK